MIFRDRRKGNTRRVWILATTTEIPSRPLHLVQQLAAISEKLEWRTDERRYKTGDQVDIRREKGRACCFLHFAAASVPDWKHSLLKTPSVNYRHSVTLRADWNRFNYTRIERRCEQLYVKDSWSISTRVNVISNISRQILTSPTRKTRDLSELKIFRIFRGALYARAPVWHIESRTWAFRCNNLICVHSINHVTVLFNIKITMGVEMTRFQYFSFTIVKVCSCLW